MSHQRISKLDTRIVEGAQLCTHCQRVKSLDAFGVNRSKGRPDRPRQWCKACTRIQAAIRQDTPERQAWLAAYHARPDVQERRRACDRRRNAKPARAATTAKAALRWARSPRGKLMQCRSRAVRRLEGAIGEVERGRLMSVIRVCDRELGRIKA